MTVPVDSKTLRCACTYARCDAGFANVLSSHFRADTPSIITPSTRIFYT